MALGVVSAAFGSAALVAGILARVGLWRGRWVENYRNDLLQRPARNGVFALIPGGLAFLLFSPDVQCGGDNFRSISWCTSPLNPLTMVLGLIAVVAFFVVAFAAPGWSKPAWLREAERNNWQGYRASSDHRLGYAIAFAMVVVLAGAVFLIGPGTPAEWTGPVLIALGLGGGLLVWRKREPGS